jgi:ATPase complex subunit ATP10
MTNSRIGYVYLVDENLKIRWAACADAKEEEEKALFRCTRVLLDRHKQHSPKWKPRLPEQLPRNEEK